MTETIANRNRFSFNKIFFAKQFYMDIIYYQFYMDIIHGYVHILQSNEIF